ncbi:HupE/UreJ family protein [Marinovum sp.]|uniref:HupE/UreJ family protein n=1 Tax=Marinovum sp. TaxID=2024839 RepID=UPI003A9217E2
MLLTERDGGTEVYVFSPVPLVFADVLTGGKDPERFLAKGGPESAPGVILLPEAVAAAPEAFAERLSRSLDWRIGPRQLTPEVLGFNILPGPPPEGTMTSPGTAAALLAHPSPEVPVAIGTGYVGMLLRLEAQPRLLPLTVEAGMPALTLSDGVRIDNHVVDARGAGSRSFTRPGQLERPLTLPQSWVGWAAEYIYQGVVHILEGIDHVFLVVAMSLAATAGLGLLRNITAFTLGHAVTLAVGFMGYVPASSWFIPGVEAAIAATIILAAVTSYLRLQSSALIYVAIGLLHGFGFSFVLGRLLGPGSPDLLPALAAFTVGVEIGQLAIVAGVLALFFALRQVSAPGAEGLRKGVLVLLGLAAAYMVVERIPDVIFA